MRILIVGAVLALVSASADAQKRRGKCTGDAPDTNALVRVYRDCDVDRVAKLKGSPPRLNFAPPPGRPLASDGCLYAEFDFVVDTSGRVNLASVKPRSGNDRALEDAVMQSLPSLLYEPAMLNGLRVPQLVFYEQKVGFMTRTVMSSGTGGAPPPPPSRGPRC